MSDTQQKIPTFNEVMHKDTMNGKIPSFADIMGESKSEKKNLSQTTGENLQTGTEDISIQQSGSVTGAKPTIFDTPFLDRDIEKRFDLSLSNPEFTKPKDKYSLSNLYNVEAQERFDLRKEGAKIDIKKDTQSLTDYNNERISEINNDIKDATDNLKGAFSAQGYGAKIPVEVREGYERDIASAQMYKDKLKKSVAMEAINKIVPQYVDPEKTFDPRQLGREILKVADPERELQYQDAEKEGATLPSIQLSSFERFGIDAAKSYLQSQEQTDEIKNRLQEVESYEKTFDERNFELTAQRVKEKLGVYFYDQGKSGFFGYSGRNIEKAVNDPAAGLTDVEKRVALDYVLPIENRLVFSTDIPGSGFFRSGKNAIERSVIGAGNTISGILGERGDAERAYDNINREVEQSRFRQPGESPSMKSELYQLKVKEETNELSNEEKDRKLELEKYVDVRNGFSKFTDGVGDLTGQVIQMALLTKGIGAVGKTFTAVAESGGLLSGGITSSAIGTALSNETVGLFLNSYLQSYDNYKSQALELMPGDKNAANRDGYAKVMAAVEGLSERIFRDTKVLNAFTKSASPTISAITNRFINKEITQQVAREELQTALMKYAKPFGKSFVKSEVEEAGEEAVVDWAAGISESVFGGQPFDLIKTGQQSLNTFLTTALYSPLVSGMAAHGAAGQNRSENAFYKSAIVDIAANPTSYLASVEELKLNGVINQDQANEKIKLINSAQKYFKEIPKTVVSVNKGDEGNVLVEKELDYPEVSSYLVHRLNEGILNEQLEKTSDPVIKEELETKINRSVAIRKGITDNSIGVSPDIIEVTDNPKKAAELGIADVTQVQPDELIGTKFSQKPEATITEETTVESAVIEIGGKTYEGKNHAEAILKAKEDGQDISQVDRKGQGKFKLSDGTIIDRAEAKSRFGQDQSELLIPQDEAANQANKEYGDGKQPSGLKEKDITDAANKDVLTETEKTEPPVSSVDAAYNDNLVTPIDKPEMVSVKELKDDAGVLFIKKESQDAIQESVTNEGVKVPIIVNKDNGDIIDGSHRLAAAQKGKIKEIPVIYVTGLSRKDGTKASQDLINDIKNKYESKPVSSVEGGKKDEYGTPIWQNTKTNFENNKGETVFKGKSGNEYRITEQEGETPKDIQLYVYGKGNENPIGLGHFKKNADGSFSVDKNEGIGVNENRRDGIASAMYDYIDKNHGAVKKTNSVSRFGENLWNKNQQLSSVEGGEVDSRSKETLDKIKEDNDLRKAHILAQGFIWDGENWVHPDYPGKSVYSSDVPPPKKADIEKELEKIRQQPQEKLSEAKEQSEKLPVKVGDRVGFTTPVIQYKGNEPFTIQDKRNGIVKSIKQNGDIEVKDQQGNYHTLKPNEINREQSLAKGEEAKQPEKPRVRITAQQVKAGQPEKAKSTRQEQTNSLRDQVDSYNGMPVNAKGKASALNNLRLKATDLGLKIDNNKGFAILRNEKGNRVQRRSAKTNAKAAKSFVPKLYSERTQNAISKIVADPSLMVGLAIKGEDGYRLSEAQKEAAIESLKSNSPNVGAKAIYDFFEKAEDGNVIIEDLATGQETSIPIDEHFGVVQGAVEATDQDIEELNTILGEDAFDQLSDEVLNDYYESEGISEGTEQAATESTAETTQETGDIQEPPQSSKTISQKEDFHSKVDKAADSLIRALSAKLPPGVKKSGIGIEEIVKAAANIIKKAYDLGTNIKAAIEEAIKYVKDQFRDNGLGEVDEAILRDYFEKDVLAEITKEKEAEIKAKRKEAVALRKALKDIDVYSVAGLDKEQVEEIFRKQNKLTQQVQQIIDKIYDRLGQTEGTKQNQKLKEASKVAEGKKILDEVFSRIRNGQKVPRTFIRISNSDVADLVPYLKDKFSAYKAISLNQLEEVADSLIDIFGVDVASEFVNYLGINEQPIAMAKIALKLREEGRNAEAANMMANLIQTGTATGQAIKSFDRIKTLIGSVTDPTFRTQFQKAMYERGQAMRKAVEAEFNLQSDVFKEKIADMEKQLHEKTINDNKSFLSRLIDKICGVRKRK